MDKTSHKEKGLSAQRCLTLTTLNLDSQNHQDIPKTSNYHLKSRKMYKGMRLKEFDTAKLNELLEKCSQDISSKSHLLRLNDFSVIYYDLGYYQRALDFFQELASKQDLIDSKLD